MLRYKGKAGPKSRNIKGQMLRYKGKAGSKSRSIRKRMLRYKSVFSRGSVNGNPFADNAAGKLGGFGDAGSDGGGHFGGEGNGIGDRDGQDAHLAGKAEAKRAHDLAHFPQADEVRTDRAGLADFVKIAFLNLRADELFGNVAVNQQDLFPAKQLVEQRQAEERRRAHFDAGREGPSQPFRDTDAYRVVAQQLIPQAKNEDGWGRTFCPCRP
jgi:hypothetical protein